MGWRNNDVLETEGENSHFGGVLEFLPFDSIHELRECWFGGNASVTSTNIYFCAYNVPGIVLCQEHLYFQTVNIKDTYALSQAS